MPGKLDLPWDLYASGIQSLFRVMNPETLNNNQTMNNANQIPPSKNRSDPLIFIQGHPVPFHLYQSRPHPAGSCFQHPPASHPAPANQICSFKLSHGIDELL
ncbi:MAG: hypothetical protein NXI08_16950, partial [bacterium]|nr:hypothetical protein [bacterium]